MVRRGRPASPPPSPRTCTPGTRCCSPASSRRGKTTFVSALVAALGSGSAVSSPTFSLAQFYATPGPRVLHVDTYRLTDLTEFRDLGLDEYLDEVIALVDGATLVAGVVRRRRCGCACAVAGPARIWPRDHGPRGARTAARADYLLGPPSARSRREPRMTLTLAVETSSRGLQMPLGAARRRPRARPGERGPQ